MGQHFRDWADTSRDGAFWVLYKIRRGPVRTEAFPGTVIFQITSAFNLPHSSSDCRSSVQFGCLSKSSTDCCPQCPEGTGQDSCSSHQVVHRVRPHSSPEPSEKVPGVGGPVGWMWTSRVPPSEPFWSLPSPSVLCSSWSRCHLLQGLSLCHPLQWWLVLLLLGWCRLVHDKLLGGTARLTDWHHRLLYSTSVILKSCGVSSRAVCHVPCMSVQVG